MRRMPSRHLGQRAPLLWLILPLIAGLLVGRLTDFGPLWVRLAAAVIGSAAAVALSFSARRGWSIAVGVGAFFVGASSYALHRARLSAWESLPAREAGVTIEIERIFAPTDPKKRSGIARIVRSDGILSELAGQRVYFVCAPRADEPMPARDARLRLVGVLSPLPRDPPPDTFDGYLAAAGVNFRLTRTRSLRLERPPRPYYAFCDAAARQFKAILSAGIEAKRPTLAGLLRAMMLGETHELTDEQHTLFMQSGTMHLFAISGLNIAVIAGALQTLLRLARMPPWGCFLVGIPLLWLFVDITGGSPSAVRAFGMAAFFQAAHVLRRPASALPAIVASATIVLLLSPLQLFSASFLMSYSIVFALLALGAPLGERWADATALWRDLPRATWNRWQLRADLARRWLMITLAIGVATTAISVVTSVQFFHLLTPAALFANLALIPAAGAVTLAGFAALLCGLLGLLPAACFFNHAAAVALLGIESLVRLSVHTPGAYVSARYTAHWIGPFTLGAALVAILYGYSARWRLERGGWWPPFVIVAASLLGGVAYG